MLDTAMIKHNGGRKADPARPLDPASKMRAALKRVMEAKGLRPHPWATKAGISSGAIYAFMKEETDYLSMPLLAKLAAAAGVTVAVLTGEDSGELGTSVPVTHALRQDRIVPLIRAAQREAPAPVGERQDDLRVAEIQQGSWGLLQEGTHIYWHEPDTAEELGEPPRGLCVVTLGEGHVYLGTLRGPVGGPWVLITASGTIMEDAKAVSAWPVCHIIPA
jgi:hypothetical protein